MPGPLGSALTYVVAFPQGLVAGPRPVQADAFETLTYYSLVERFNTSRVPTNIGIYVSADYYPWFSLQKVRMVEKLKSQDRQRASSLSRSILMRTTPMTTRNKEHQRLYSNMFIRP